MTDSKKEPKTVPEEGGRVTTVQDRYVLSSDSEVPTPGELDTLSSKVQEWLLGLPADHVVEIRNARGRRVATVAEWMGWEALHTRMKAAPDEAVSQVARRLIDRLSKREEVGLKRYGRSLDRTDLTDQERIDNAIDELLDASSYLESLKLGSPDAVVQHEYTPDPGKCLACGLMSDAPGHSAYWATRARAYAVLLQSLPGNLGPFLLERVQEVYEQLKASNEESSSVEWVTLEDIEEETYREAPADRKKPDEPQDESPRDLRQRYP